MTVKEIDTMKAAAELLQRGLFEDVHASICACATARESAISLIALLDYLEKDCNDPDTALAFARYCAARA